MICIVESAIESLQTKTQSYLDYLLHTYITYNWYNHYIQFSDHFNQIIKIANYIFNAVRYM